MGPELTAFSKPLALSCKPSLYSNLTPVPILHFSAGSDAVMNSMPTPMFQYRGLVLTLPLLLALSLLLPPGRSAETAKPLTAEAVKELLTAFKTERSSAGKDGLSKKFSPE